MTSVFERELLVVTGKGGVGKTTVSAIVGLLGAREGKRVVVVELGEQGRLAHLFGQPKPELGAELRLDENLWSISIDPDRALLEWLQSIGGALAGRVLGSSTTFQYFAAAAPGAKELVSMVKVWELTQSARWRRRARSYDLVVLDAPATGHALAMLHSPQTFGAIARVGPIAGQTRQVKQLLADRRRSGYLAVAHASEMAVSEALEIQDGLVRQLDRELEAVIVNGVLPRRFTEPELRRVAALNGGARGDRAPRAASVTARRGRGRTAGATATAPARDAELRRAAAYAARSVHERARRQHNEVARLRRRELRVVSVPFVFAPELDLALLRRLTDQVARKL
ncbi:MAG TPA: ArsA family ATPase [Solirubrobacteraceae bacterium]|nr:ArsA family ATPase [Solirubrobacteraceae bacterium]